MPTHGLTTFPCSVPNVCLRWSCVHHIDAWVKVFEALYVYIAMSHPEQEVTYTHDVPICGESPNQIPSSNPDMTDNRLTQNRFDNVDGVAGERYSPFWEDSEEETDDEEEDTISSIEDARSIKKSDCEWDWDHGHSCRHKMLSSTLNLSPTKHTHLMFTNCT